MVTTFKLIIILGYVPIVNSKHGCGDAPRWKWLLIKICQNNLQILRLLRSTWKALDRDKKFAISDLFT